MRLIAAGLGLALVAGLVAYIVVESPRDQQRERSEVAAEQLAGWVRQAGFEPTGIEGAIEPDSDAIAAPEEGVRLTPRVEVMVEQVPITVTWVAPPPGVTQAGGDDRLDVGDRSVEIGDATHRQGRASAWFECGPTSLQVAADSSWDLDVDDLPSDGGHDAVMAVASGLATTVPCPVDHPTPSRSEAEDSPDPPASLEQPVVTDAFVAASDTVAIGRSEDDGPPDDPPNGWYWDVEGEAWVADDVPRLEVVLAGPVEDANGYVLELPDGMTEEFWHSSAAAPITLEPLPADLVADDLVGESIRVVAVSDRDPELDGTAPTPREVRQVSPSSDPIEIRDDR
jgi:hypothetical protein